MSTLPISSQLSSRPPSRKAPGFTIIELLISVIIIGILVAIVIPVFVTRANEARLRAAQQDLEALTTAQSHASIDTGYFYRLYVLDNVKGRGDDVAASEPDDDRIDANIDEARRDDVNRPTYLFIDPVYGTFLTNGDDLFARMTKDETNFNWNGPYVNVMRKTGKYEPAGSVQPYPAGMPLDPWGAPYMLFTRAGLLDERDMTGAFVGQYTATDLNTYNTDRFDRPTILSLGPNGVPGNGPGTHFGQGDDLYKQF